MASNPPENDMDPPFVMRTATASAMPQIPAAQAGSSSQASAEQAAIDLDASLPNPMTGATLPTTSTMSTAGAAASQPDASAPNVGTAACAALSTCCAALTDDDDREDCQELAERNDADRCSRVGEEVCQTQGMPTAPTTGAEACSKLQTCCSTLARPAQQRDCQQTAMRADDERCTRQLLRICPELGPPPRDPACVTLQGCCPSLTEPRALELCRRALQEDDARDCLEASAALCQ